VQCTLIVFTVLIIHSLNTYTRKNAYGGGTQINVEFVCMLIHQWCCLITLFHADAHRNCIIVLRTFHVACGNYQHVLQFENKVCLSNFLIYIIGNSCIVLSYTHTLVIRTNYLYNTNMCLYSMPDVQETLFG
jgi:hypothetical protein